MLTDEQIVKLLNHNGTRVDALKEAYRMGRKSLFSEEVLEAAFWEFDARWKGLEPWTGSPYSVRDAFKWTLRSLQQRDLSLAPSNEPGKDSAAAVDPSAKLGGDVTPIVSKDAPTQR